MTRQIGNDELGEIGEDQFKTLCSRARLIANKSTQDKMGWDYLVEFPMVEEAGRTLDQRRLPPSYRIQVKTIWKRDNDRVTLSLSAAERLAKSHEPSFICALIADLDTTDEVEIVAAYLIPMIDENLARILQRLRRAAADAASKPINTVDITFSASAAGKHFLFTGAGLKSALETACGTDEDAIRNRKAEQLRDLGYDEGRHQLNMQFTANTVQEISDAFLGISPIQVSDLREFDVRFGIPIPTDHLPAGDIKYKAYLRPSPLAVRTMRVRGLNGGLPATFQCEIIVGPQQWGLPEEMHKWIIRSSVFVIEIRGTGESVFKVDGSTVNDLSLSLDDWGHFYRLSNYLSEGGAVFELDGPDPTAPRATFTINATPNKNLRCRSEEFSNIISYARNLLDEAGLELSNLTQADIEAAAPELCHYEQLRCSKTNPIVCKVNSSNSHAFPSIVDKLLILTVDLGQLRIACVIQVTLKGPEADGCTWTESTRRVIQCSDVQQNDQALFLFAEAISKKTGVEIVMQITREE